jgi:Flp pilus assembly protein TadG
LIPLVRRPERGASAVEFALVMIPLFYLIFGIIQYGVYFWGMQSGTSATSDAVRRLTVGDCTNANELRSFIKTRLGSSSPTAASAIGTNVVYKDAGGTVVGTPTIGGSVTLTVTFDAIDLNFPFIPLPDDAEVERQVFGRVEDTAPTTNGCL